MQILREAGLSNYDILKSATLHAAQFLNISNDFGTIEVGKEASFMLLSKNPLADIKNTLSIKKVFYCGEAF
jgi:imidazolonepropionase-like amidohydrolase